MVAAVLALRRRFTLRQPGERFRMLRLEFLWGTGIMISRSAAYEGEGVLGVLRVSSRPAFDQARVGSGTSCATMVHSVSG